MDTTSKVGAHGNVGEAMKGPSRIDLLRLHPVPSGAAQFPSAAMHKNRNAVPFFSVDTENDECLENLT